MRIVFFQEIFNGSYLVVYSLQDSCCLFTISYRDIDMIFQIFAYSQSRFVHVKLPNPQTVGFEFHLQKVITTIGLRAGSLCFFLLLYRADETQPGSHSCLGFQFGLYHVAVALRFLRIIGLARLLSICLEH